MIKDPTQGNPSRGWWYFSTWMWPIGWTIGTIMSLGFYAKGVWKENYLK